MSKYTPPAEQSFIEKAKYYRYEQIEQQYKPFRKNIYIELKNYSSHPGILRLARKYSNYRTVDISANEMPGLNAVDALTQISERLADAYSGFETLNNADFYNRARRHTYIKLEEIERLIDKCRYAVFPTFREKFSYGLSDDEEAKNLILKNFFRRLKDSIDKYYYTFELCSINPDFEELRKRFAVIKSNFATMEMLYYKHVIILKSRDELKIRMQTDSPLKPPLLKLRRFLEAFEQSDAGKLVTMLQSYILKKGIYLYGENTPDMKIYLYGKQHHFDFAGALAKYDAVMIPIFDAVKEYNELRKQQKAKLLPIGKVIYWDISEKIDSFRNSMEELLESMKGAFKVGDNDYKAFDQSVRNVLIPYFILEKGTVNESFKLRANEIERFFLYACYAVIGNSNPNGYSYQEILGLSVDSDKAKEDYHKYIDELEKENPDIIKNRGKVIGDLNTVNLDGVDEETISF